MIYRNYKNARNEVWKFIIEQGINSLPVDLPRICANLGVKLFTYNEKKNLIKLLDMENKIKEIDGFTAKILNKHYIFYNSDCVKGRQNFTIAHEIGHIVLGHSEDIIFTRAISKWNEEDNEPDYNEMQANIFASRLLAPACVLWGLDIHSPEEISALCGLSKQASTIRAERMKVLYERNQFLKSELERKAYSQFEVFINNKRKVLEKV